MLKLQADVTRKAERIQPAAILRGEKLTEMSAMGEGRWTIGGRVLAVLGFGALAWLAVLFLPGLVNDVAGFLLGLLLQAMA